MIRLEQIRELENKIHAAVARIRALSSENERLKENLLGYESRIADLQREVDGLKNDQDEIEAGIVSALQHLDQLEDGIGDGDSPDASGGGKPNRASAATKPKRTDSAKSTSATASTDAARQAEAAVSTNTADPASARTDSATAEPGTTDAADSTATRRPVSDEPEPTLDDEEEPELDIF